MLADPIGIPACFSSSGGGGGERERMGDGVTRAGQRAIMSVYRAKLGDESRLITITWCRNPLLLHGLSVSLSSLSPSPDGGPETFRACKVELKPWYFWRKQGTKRFDDDGGKAVDVYWDLRSAKFSNGDTQPSSDYYVAVVCGGEVALLVGDLRVEAYKKTGCGPALFDPTLVSKKEHIFGKKRFLTRAKLHENGSFHEIVIECRNKSREGGPGRAGPGHGGPDPEMEVRVDGLVAIQVKRLQWKFRGNEVIHVNRLRIEVFWDVHDWLFSPGLRHALFIFRPVVSPLAAAASSSSSSLSSLMSSPPPPSSRDGSSGGGCSVVEGLGGSMPSEFSLFLYAWRVE